MIKASGFNWDKGNQEKCQKHGVSITEIEFVLKHAPLIAPDVKHSHTERRYIAIGRTKEDRFLYIAFALRERVGRQLLRPVSARYMHGKEIRSYEKKANQADAGSRHDDG